MNSKTKKTPYRILKVIWALIGISLLIWTISTFTSIHSVNNLGVIVWVVLFTIGLYSLFIYSGITILFLLIKWIIKKIIKVKDKKGMKRK